VSKRAPCREDNSQPAGLFRRGPNRWRQWAVQQAREPGVARRPRRHPPVPPVGGRRPPRRKPFLNLNQGLL